MSKTENKPKVSIEEANNVFNQLETTGQSAVSFEEAFEMLQNAPDGSLENLSRSYFKFDKQGDYYFVVQGLSTMKKDDKVVEVVEMMNKEKEQFINGDQVFVTAVRKLTTIPCFVKVVYKGDVRNNKGTYKNLEVHTFSGNTQ